MSGSYFATLAVNFEIFNYFLLWYFFSFFFAFHAQVQCGFTSTETIRNILFPNLDSSFSFFFGGGGGGVVLLIIFPLLIFLLVVLLL